MIEYLDNGNAGEPKQNEKINLIAFCADYDTCIYNKISHDSSTKGTNGH